MSAWFYQKNQCIFFHYASADLHFFPLKSLFFKKVQMQQQQKAHV